MSRKSNKVIHNVSVSMQLRAQLPPVKLAPLSDSSISFADIGKSIARAIDQEVLKDAEVCVLSNPRLGIHPWQYLLHPGNLVGLAILQHELGNPDRFAARSAVCRLKVGVEIGWCVVGVPMNGHEVYLATAAVAQERIQPSKADIWQDAIAGVCDGGPSD
jgi:hypothetical protein